MGVSFDLEMMLSFHEQLGHLNADVDGPGVLKIRVPKKFLWVPNNLDL